MPAKPPAANSLQADAPANLLAQRIAYRWLQSKYHAPILKNESQQIIDFDTKLNQLMTNTSDILDSPELKDLTIFFEEKSILNEVICLILRIINLIANLSIWLSFAVFYYFVYEASKIIGHIPVYGDKEFIHIGMGDKYEIIDFFFTIGIIGFIISLILISLNLTLKLYRVKKVSLILGIIGFVLQITYLFSPQFEWFVD